MRTLGTAAACPPYHVRLSLAAPRRKANTEPLSWPRQKKYYDACYQPKGNEHGQALGKVIELEKNCCLRRKILKSGRAVRRQYFAHDIRVIRLPPRHGASCPVGMGVSCSADRNIKAKINREGSGSRSWSAIPVIYSRALPGGRARSGAR